MPDPLERAFEVLKSKNHPWVVPKNYYWSLGFPAKYWTYTFVFNILVQKILFADMMHYCVCYWFPRWWNNPKTQITINFLWKTNPFSLFLMRSFRRGVYWLILYQLMIKFTIFRHRHISGHFIIIRVSLRSHEEQSPRASLAYSFTSDVNIKLLQSPKARMRKSTFVGSSWRRDWSNPQDNINIVVEYTTPMKEDLQTFNED